MKKKNIFIFITVISLILLCLVNMFVINQKQLKVRQVTIEKENIDPSFNNFVIAYFSDTYFDKADSNMLELVANKINAYSPDVVIFGGDLVEDGSKVNKQNIIEELSSINSAYGKFAILGENDNNFAKGILESSGFKVLSNDSNQIYMNSKEFINIVGIDNMVNASPNIEEAYEKVISSHFTFSVCHTPDIINSIPSGKTDFLACGHSLGGEVYLPIINNFVREKGAESYYHGTYDINGTIVDVTNGIGHKNKSARLLADAEIVIYKLKLSD